MYTTSLVFLALLAQLSPQSADPEAKAKAQGLLTEGSRLYGEGDYAGALEKFNAAYDAYPSPKLMFNIGQANRDLSRPVEALASFEKFLRDATDASPETTADARRSVAELQGKLGRIMIHCETPGAQVTLDGKDVGVTPLADLVWATPGHHQVTARHARAAFAIEEVDVAQGVVQVVNLRLQTVATPTAAAPAPAPEPVRDLHVADKPPSGGSHAGWWLGRKWTWVAAGSSVVLAAGAIAAGVSMQSRYDSLKASCGATQLGCSDSDISSVTARRNLANVLWGVTGAAVVTAGVLFYVEGRPVSVSPVAGEMTGALARVAF